MASNELLIRFPLPLKLFRSSLFRSSFGVSSSGNGVILSVILSELSIVG